MRKKRMANRQTQVKARSVTGEEVHLLEQRTDSPLVDTQALEKLNNIRPDLVDWVIEQTTKEAEYRRTEVHRINSFEFFERIGGLILSVVICISGIIGSIVAFSYGSERLGIVLAIATIATLAAGYLKRS